VAFCTGADLLIHDGEYNDVEYSKLKEWGHSSYSDALKLSFAAGVKRLGLFHLNQERTDDQVDDIVDHCRQIIANAGQSLECFAVGRDMTFTI
jgi:ribonuclease BN (tRNA processing enzyme)